MPYLMGTERFKGSHSMSGYHSFELCYLAQVYTNLLITKQPLDFYFKPLPGGFKDNILRVSPDILPPGSIRIGEVWVDDEPYTEFDADTLTVKLPDSKSKCGQGAHRPDAVISRLSCQVGKPPRASKSRNVGASAAMMKIER